MNPYAPPQSRETPPPDWRAEQRYGPPPLASLGKRLGGAMIDGLAVASTAMVLGRVAREIAGSQDAALFVYLASFVMHGVQWFLLATRGQTLGKMAVGTQVVRYGDAAWVGFGRSVMLRAWPLLALGAMQVIHRPLQPIVTAISLADALAIFFFGERRTLHDRIAGTMVIDVSGRGRVNAPARS